ncbi:uncharacterized protein LOC123260109 [Cotesia glomerata]|uniref:uncharacterized protein LOC123260109 n=1 Tax=Cotesia glomerata TaxID=32391 RepID=UPI001D023B4F|nr:uncharacterized protein LOC123260109 [Cotesia glomerata]
MTADAVTTAQDYEAYHIVLYVANRFCSVTNGFHSKLKKNSPLFIVLNTNGNEDFVCQGVLISPSLILSIGDCARSLYFSSNNNDTYIYDSSLNRKYIRRSGYYFIRNVALINTEDPVITENQDDYIFKLASDVENINFTKCKLQSVESDIIKDYSCASENNLQNVTKMGHHNYIHCAVIDYDNIKYGDLLTCSRKNSEEMVLVGFEYHLYYKWSSKYPTEPISMQFINLSYLGMIIRHKLNSVQWMYEKDFFLSPKNKRIFSILSTFKEN